MWKMTIYRYFALLNPGNAKGGSITVLLTSCLTGLESAVWHLTSFCFHLQNRLIQTSQTGGQQYSDTSPFSIPCSIFWTSSENNEYLFIGTLFNKWEIEKIVVPLLWGEISYQFLLPGGSVGHRYVLHLLFSENSKLLKKTQQPLKLERKNKHRFGILRT